MLTRPLVLPLTGKLAVSPLDDPIGGDILLSDLFTRADNANSMGNADTGETWEAIVANWGIRTNRAYKNDLVVFTGIAGLPCRSALGRVRVLLGTVPTDGSQLLGISFRIVDADNHFRAVVWNPNLAVQKTVAGAVTTLYSAAHGETLAANMPLDVLLTSGDGIEVRLNSISKFSGSDSAHASAQKHGLNTGSGGTALDFESFEFRYPIPA